MRVATSDHPTRPVLGIAFSLGLLAILGLAAVASDQEGPWDSDIGISVAIVLVVLISGLLVAKRPDHPVSWLMALTALLGTVAGVAADTLPPGITELAWWQVPLAIASGPSWYGLLLTVMVLIPLLFPTGSPPSLRWRWVAWAAVGTVLLMTAIWIVQEEFCTDWGDESCLATVANPIGIGGVANPEESIVGPLAYVLLLLCSLAAVASLVVRFRRSTRVERSQIKWVLLSFGLFVLGFVAFDVIWMEMLGQPEPSGPVATVAGQITWVLIPASIAVAILRYRLYDIDRIISRTLSYALILTMLGLVALGLVSGFALFLPNDDPLVVAISTLVVAALFNPLRKRVQKTVDRRFNRSRFDAERVVQGLASTLQERVDPEGVVDGWVGVVSETMQPAAVGVWVREPGQRVEIP